jgi:hypothetical protein
MLMPYAMYYDYYCTHNNSFTITSSGASIGQGPGNTMSIPSDTTLSQNDHAFIMYCALDDEGKTDNSGLNSNSSTKSDVNNRRASMVNTDSGVNAPCGPSR